jgi:hypothetical protein
VKKIKKNSSLKGTTEERRIGEEIINGKRREN